MAESEGIPLLLPTAWEAEVLRVTAFPIPAAPARDYGWWRELVGEPPERSINRPRESSLREEGPFNGGILINEIQPLRIDWVLAPPQEEGVEAVGFRFIGPFPQAVDAFLQLVTRWLDLTTCPDLLRLAFGAIVLHPVGTKVAGYQQLAAYLPSVQVDPEGSSDFLYQINRQRLSRTGVPGLMLNRLSKWSVATIQEVKFVVAQGAAGQVISGDIPAIACRLELDINTEAGRREALPRDSLDRLLQELADLAIEIVSKGDIP